MDIYTHIQVNNSTLIQLFNIKHISKQRDCIVLSEVLKLRINVYMSGLSALRKLMQLCGFEVVLCKLYSCFNKFKQSKEI